MGARYKKPIVRKVNEHVVRVRLTPGSARPGPPLSGLLAPYGVDIPKFCLEFNKLSLELTSADVDLDVIIYINVLKKNFSFKIKGLSITYLMEIVLNESIVISFFDIYKIFLVKKYFMKEFEIADRVLFKSIVHNVKNYLRGNPELIIRK